MQYVESEDKVIWCNRSDFMPTCAKNSVNYLPLVIIIVAQIEHHCMKQAIWCNRREFITFHASTPYNFISSHSPLLTCRLKTIMKQFVEEDSLSCIYTSLKPRPSTQIFCSHGVFSTAVKVSVWMAWVRGHTYTVQEPRHIVQSPVDFPKDDTTNQEEVVMTV